MANSWTSFPQPVSAAAAASSMPPGSISRGRQQWSRLVPQECTKCSLLVQVQPIPHISVIQLGSSRIAAIGHLMLATQLWNRWKSMISNKLIYIELYRHIWNTSSKNYANKGRHPVEWDCPLQLAFPNLGIPFHLLVTVIIIFLIQTSIWKESSSCKQGHTWWSQPIVISTNHPKHGWNTIFKTPNQIPPHTSFVLGFRKHVYLPTPRGPPQASRAFRGSFSTSTGGGPAPWALTRRISIHSSAPHFSWNGGKQQLNHTTIHFREVFRNLESWTVRFFGDVQVKIHQIGLGGESWTKGVYKRCWYECCMYAHIYIYGEIAGCAIYSILYSSFILMEYDGVYIWFRVPCSHPTPLYIYVYIYIICGILIAVLIWWEHHGNITECTICLNHMHSNLTIHIQFCTWFRYRSHLPWYSLPSKVMVTPVFPPATEATPSGWQLQSGMSIHAAKKNVCGKFNMKPGFRKWWIPKTIGLWRLEQECLASKPLATVGGGWRFSTQHEFYKFM